MRNRNKLIATITLAAAMSIGLGASAQMTGRNPGMMGGGWQSFEERDDHTAKEEAEGKEIWDKFQKKEVSCDNLSEENFAALGEYFMGLMTGESHAAMNEMMVRMMGEEGEEDMHVVMGKRLSGCDTSAAFSAEARGFMPMMGMTGWGGTSDAKGVSRWGWGFGPMMGYPMNGYVSFGWLGWIFGIFWWALIILGIVTGVRWIAKRGKNGSALNLLKERYAKGEITKKEFEEVKKELD